MLNVKFVGASVLVLNVEFGRRFASWLRAVPFVTSYATGGSLIETACAVAAKTFAELVP